MRTVRTVSELRAALGPARCAGEGTVVVGRNAVAGSIAGSAPSPSPVPVGFVPTMGALHAGHIALIEAARRRCGTVVVSVFVNPTQFDDPTDLDRYPRDERRDAEIAQAAGADILFAPGADEIYPAGFCTSVRVAGALTECLEGACRGAGHFHGVTTVVCRLLGLVAPDVAFFGCKDAQQVAVVSRMVCDLGMDVEIATVPTVREADGLAASSRNVRLSAQERERALALHAALSAAQRAAGAGESDGRRLRDVAAQAMAPFDVQPEYVEIVDAETFEPVESLRTGGLLVLAARIGHTRLIDNVHLSRPIAVQADATGESRVRAQSNGSRDDGAAGDRGRRADDQQTQQQRQGDVIAACSA